MVVGPHAEAPACKGAEGVWNRLPAVDETEELGLKDTQAFWKTLPKNAGSPVVWDELEVCILTTPEPWAYLALTEPYINVQIERKKKKTRSLC